MNPLKLDPNGHPMPVFNPGANQTTIILDGSSASAASAVLSATKNLNVLITVDGDCTIKIAPTPTATANDFPLWEGSMLDLVIPAGCKIAVLGAKLYMLVHQE